MTRFRNYGLWLPLLSTLLLLGACGIKPGKLEPPQGTDNDTFPREYPAPVKH